MQRIQSFFREQKSLEEENSNTVCFRSCRIC